MTDSDRSQSAESVPSGSIEALPSGREGGEKENGGGGGAHANHTVALTNVPAGKRRMQSPRSSLSASSEDESDWEEEEETREDYSTRKRKRLRTDTTDPHREFKEQDETERHGDAVTSCDAPSVPPRPDTPSPIAIHSVATVEERASSARMSPVRLATPTLRVQPVLGGKTLSLPLTPRLTVLDLKDFILFTLNIPHFQQILTFTNLTPRPGTSSPASVVLSSLPDTTPLHSIPGLVNVATGACRPVALAFKMSSGMEFGVSPSDLEGASGGEFYGEEGAAFFEAFATDDDKRQNLDLEQMLHAATGATGATGATEATDTASNGNSENATGSTGLFSLSAGLSASSKIFVRSLSKGSSMNGNVPTLWEVYLPDSGVKLVVSAVVNPPKGQTETEAAVTVTTTNAGLEGLLSDGDSGDETGVSTPVPTLVSTPVSTPVPTIVISPEPQEGSITEDVMANLGSLQLDVASSPEPRPYCGQCHVRCRPALRFVCKCGTTFCQTHRYPDQHGCTFDHRAAAAAVIQANNPKIVRDKVGNF